MSDTIRWILSGILFIIAFFCFRRAGQRSAEVLDLTKKIDDNKSKLVIQQKDADAKIKEYEDALKKYDPEFYNDDGTPKGNA